MAIKPGPDPLKIQEPVSPFHMSWMGWVLLGLLIFLLVFFEVVLKLRD